MSHAVIVSRELGIPCVVSVTDATRLIPDGALIEVDGTAGRVRILESAD
jgi:pyruvate,water dikinase